MYSISAKTKVPERVYNGAFYDIKSNEKKTFYRKKSPPKRGIVENRGGNMTLRPVLLGKQTIIKDANSGPSLVFLDYRRVKKYISLVNNINK